MNNLNIENVESFIVDLALGDNPFLVAAALYRSYPTAQISCVEGVITITKKIPFSNKEVTTGWNHLASDPNTNAVMIATALTDAGCWMNVFPTLLSKLKREWAAKSKQKKEATTHGE